MNTNLMGMHVVIVGNPRDGVEIYGPFKTGADAVDYGHSIEDEWWIAPLQAPKCFEQEDVPNTFATFNNTQALSEGWGLFNVGGYVQLQRIDYSQGGEPKFTCDARAIMFVAQRANEGSAYHSNALSLSGTLVEG